MAPVTRGKRPAAGISASNLSKKQKSSAADKQDKKKVTASAAAVPVKTEQAEPIYLAESVQPTNDKINLPESGSDSGGDDDVEYMTALNGDSSDGEQSSDEETMVAAPMESVVEQQNEKSVVTDEFNSGRAEIKLDQSTVKSIRTKISAAQKKSASEKINNPQKRGVVYLGRIPHGFYEEQMREYFSQFGAVTRLRLSRNKKTGHSKHYAFIEFESVEVAEVVAETMDNYLLFGHILKCKFVPEQQQHEKLWVGANRQFRPVPWAKINRIRHNRPKTEEQSQRQRQRLVGREQKLRSKLKDLGIEYDFAGYSSQA